jgi:hypothetical protein
VARYKNEYGSSLLPSPFLIAGSSCAKIAGAAVAEAETAAADQVRLDAAPRSETVEKLDGSELETIKAILNQRRRDRVYARSDPLPRMREWLGKLDEHYHCL